MDARRRFPFHSPVSLSEKTSNNKVEYRRKSADLLCESVMLSASRARSTRETVREGFEPTVRKRIKLISCQMLFVMNEKLGTDFADAADLKLRF